jgi:hypothetical protein
MRVPHTVRSSASSFNLQYSVFSLRLSSSCLLFLPRLHSTSILPSIMCFRRQFQHKMWPVRLAFLLLFYIEYSFPILLYVILVLFLHDRSSQSSSFFSSTSYQFDLLSKVSSFSTVQKPCSEFSTSLVSSKS